MGHKNFRKDLEEEGKLKAFLQANNIDKKIFSKVLDEEVREIEWIEGNHKEFDHIVKTANSCPTVEWKMDLLCRNTGNCYVETWAWGKDSGITVTTADYWAKIVLSKVHPGKARFGVWQTSDYIELVRSRAFKRGVPGGDPWPDGPNGRAAVGYLVKEFQLFDSKYLKYEKLVDQKKFLKATGIVVK